MSIKELAPTYYTRLCEVLSEIDNPEKLLDAGCGDGFYDQLIDLKTGVTTSFDYNQGEVLIARDISNKKNINYYIGDIQNIPHKNNLFDCIICAEVLEHVKYEEKALRELVRTLKAGGKLIITVPSKDFPFFYDPVNYILNKFNGRLQIGAWSWGHKRLYSADDLIKKIQLPIIKTRYLSHSLIGIIENSYISSILQRFVKNDPYNQGMIGENSSRFKKYVKHKPFKLLSKVRDFFIRADDMLFLESKKSIGILLVFEKNEDIGDVAEC